MQMKISEIGLSDLQAAVNEDAASVSAKTIRNAVGLVRAVIGQYRELSFRRLRLPQRKRTEHPFLDAGGIVALFDAIRGHQVELPLLLAVWLGMRRSEIMGVCWDCVDLARGRISIRRTCVRGADGGYVLRDGTKTAASARDLELPGYIAAKLASSCPPERREGRVFTMHPNTLYKSMQTICLRHGVDFVGIHGLRHTNASVMLSLGVIDKVVMALGGWSTDVTMKAVYQHVFQSDVSQAGALRNEFFQQLLVPSAAAPPAEKQ